MVVMKRPLGLLLLLLLAVPAWAQGIGGNGGGGIGANDLTHALINIPGVGQTQLGAALGNACGVAAAGCAINSGASLSSGHLLSLSFALTNLPSTGNYFVIDNEDSFNWPYTANGCCRVRYWSDTVNVTGDQTFSTQVIEANFFNLRLTGTGSLTNEAFNVVHPFAEIDAGVTLAAGGGAEVLESSASNFGTIAGSLTGVEALFTNQNTGTTAEYDGVYVHFVNANTTAGSFVKAIGLHCTAPSGAGSAIVNDICIQNQDANASIQTLGGIVVGGLKNQAAGTVEIDGPDSLTSTFPLLIKSSTAVVFSLNDVGDGSFTHSLGVGANGGASNGFIQLNTTVTGEGVKLVTTPLVSGIQIVTIPDATTTLAGLAVAQTWTAAQTYGSGSSITFSTLPSGTAATYACFTSGGQLISSGTAC